MSIRSRLQKLRDRLSNSNNDPIKHVIVLMFENHSFDQMLGCFQERYSKLEGVDSKNLRINRCSKGVEYRQARSDNPIVKHDPKHELTSILNHIANNNGGFITEYEKDYPETTVEERQRIMDYYGLGDLPALHALAEHFTICDHWFSSVPGPTWTNRFFVHSGTSKGRVHMPEGWSSNPMLYLGYDQDTIYDRLEEKGISWKVYFGDVPQSLVLKNQRKLKNRDNYKWLDRFFEDASQLESEFPQYSFIEPKYFPGVFEPQNDDHPPYSTIDAQRLLGRVYNALRANEDLWNSSLLVVIYDEHGGFYDHVSPPKTICPDDFCDEWTFDRLGVRVPALLVSPWVDAGVFSETLDHTSVLKYVIEKWGLNALTKRVSSAKSLAPAIRKSGKPRPNTPKEIPEPAPAMMATPEEIAEEPLNEHQKALLEFSEFLQEQTAPSARMMRGPAEAIEPEGEAAKHRVEDFLQQGQVFGEGP